MGATPIAGIVVNALHVYCLLHIFYHCIGIGFKFGSRHVKKLPVTWLGFDFLLFTLLLTIVTFTKIKCSGHKDITEGFTKYLIESCALDLSKISNLNNYKKNVMVTKILLKDSQNI